MSSPPQGTLPGVEAQRGDVSSDACFTPKYIIEAATEAMGHIDTDPCWHPDSHVRPLLLGYDGKETGDGLTMEWVGNVWMNCPYSEPEPWSERFQDHCHSQMWNVAQKSPTALALLKLDPTTQWWRNMRCSNIGRFPTYVGLVDHRVKFEGQFAKGGAPNMCVAFHACGILHSHLKRTIPFADWGQP